MSELWTGWPNLGHTTLFQDGDWMPFDLEGNVEEEDGKSFLDYSLDLKEEQKVKSFFLSQTHVG